jgi:NAD(P)-dependent dehydrogenase (short-subunit alcohol dehydrogenase family)
MEKKSIHNKVAVITGGGGVLCSTFAQALAKEKVKVAILDINKSAAEAVAKKITNNNGIAIGLEANVLELDSLNKAKKIITEKLGKCDILINGAGGNHPKATTTKEYLFTEDLNNKEITTFFNLDPSGIEFVFNLNFIGTLLPTQVFSKNMEKGSTIINISSMNANIPLTKIPAYSAAKAAVSNFTKWLSVHMSKVGIRVNAISPGFFLTEQNKNLLTNKDGSFTPRAKKIINQTPMERFGKPEELIGTLLWLADETKSSFVNGTVIPVDGGFSAYSGV